ncbi:MAG: chromate transporter [Spirochaetaceae bacterium]|jgi:chromate transporter|nr:chromate transporter [Spirochaetaceae bacterium]
MKEYLDLLWTFFKMGCLTFGGGYSMLPVVERELVRHKGWATLDEVMDYFAIGQVTPGVIAVNVSTFIGYKKKGILGGILTTLGFVLPSLVIITVIAAGLQNFAESEMVQHAFKGIRVAVGALILEAVRKLFKGAVKDLKTLALCLAVFGLSVFFKVSPVPMVLSAGLAGFLLYRKRGTGHAGGGTGGSAGNIGKETP